MVEYKTYLNWDHISAAFMIKNADIGFLAAWSQSSLMIHNLSKATLVSGTLSWSEEIVLKCPVTGTVVTIPSGSTSVADGNILVADGQPKFPIKGGGAQLKGLDPTTPEAKKAKYIFLGAVHEGALYLRPSATVKGGSAAAGAGLTTISIPSHHTIQRADASGSTMALGDMRLAYRVFHATRLGGNPQARGRVQYHWSPPPEVTESSKFQFRLFAAIEEPSWDLRRVAPWNGKFLAMQCRPFVIEAGDYMNYRNAEERGSAISELKMLAPDDANEGLSLAFPWSNEFNIGGLTETSIVIWDFNDIIVSQPSYMWQYLVSMFQVGWKD